MSLTTKEREILSLSLELLDRYYNEQEEICRKFKHICHKNLPQSGEEYVKNINVFEIQDKTIMDLRKDKIEAKELILKLLK